MNWRCLINQFLIRIVLAIKLKGKKNNNFCFSQDFDCCNAKGGIKYGGNAPSESKRIEEVGISLHSITNPLEHLRWPDCSKWCVRFFKMIISETGSPVDLSVIPNIYYLYGRSNSFLKGHALRTIGLHHLQLMWLNGSAQLLFELNDDPNNSIIIDTSTGILFFTSCYCFYSQNGKSEIEYNNSNIVFHLGDSRWSF